MFTRKLWKKILRLALRAAVVFMVLTVAWFLFESAWDRRIFRESEGTFTMNLSSTDGAALLTREPGLQVLDVRPAYESFGGRLPGALCLSSSDADFPDRLVAELDPAKPVLVYCAGGVRSRLAVGKLKEVGFIRIYHLNRGMLGWMLGGHPVESESEAE